MAQLGKVEENKRLGIPNEKKDLIDKHFIKVSFAISTLVLYILQPLSLLLGMVGGFLLNKSIQPNLKVKNSGEILTVMNAAAAIVAAIAALVLLTPGGSLGGIIRLVPLLFSMGVGSSIYRGYSWLTTKSS